MTRFHARSIVAATLFLTLWTAAQAQPASAAALTPAMRQLDLGLKFGLEPKAIDILKAASAKIAAAKTLAFTAVATFESPARTGQPLAYLPLYHVLLRRPDGLRVISPGDGPASEFYYNGRTVMAFSPAANFVAIAQAPGTIDEMLKAAYDVAAIYFPFTDLIVADPYEALSRGLKVAFYMGQSHIVGDTTTDIVVVANDAVQAQIWIGAQDRLPRMVRATYFDEPGNYRHTVEFRDWKLDVPIASGSFTSAQAAGAPRMQFRAPSDRIPQMPALGEQKP